MGLFNRSEHISLGGHAVHNGSSQTHALTLVGPAAVLKNKEMLIYLLQKMYHGRYQSDLLWKSTILKFIFIQFKGDVSVEDLIK